MTSPAPHPSSAARAAVGTPPTRPVLADYLARQVTAALLVAAAGVWLSHRGQGEHLAPYLVMAAALLPNVLLAALALTDEDRRHRLRASARPAPFPAGVAVLLGGAGMVGWMVGEPWTTAVAAVLAAGGLALSAAPTGLVLPPRR